MKRQKRQRWLPLSETLMRGSEPKSEIILFTSFTQCVFLWRFAKAQRVFGGIAAGAMFFDNLTERVRGPWQCADCRDAQEVCPQLAEERIRSFDLNRPQEKVVTRRGNSKGFLKVLKDSKGKLSNLFLFFMERRGRMEQRANPGWFGTDRSHVP